MDIEWQVIIKLLLAVIFGGLIGYERESAHRPAGFRTNILVCLGAALIVTFELYYHEKNPDATDHLRMAAQVITGIGFLGAGTIIHQRSYVVGLTTAATIWVTAAIGMAVGGGFYFPAAITVIMAFLSLKFLKMLERRFTMKRGRLILINSESKGNFSNKLNEVFSEKGIPIWDVRISVDADRLLEASVRVPANIDVDALFEEIMKIDGVQKVTSELLLG